MRSIFSLAAALVILGSWALSPVRLVHAGEAKPPSERELRQAMNRAEKRFLDLYNQLNPDSRHQMECESEDRAGSRLRGNRTCRTRGASSITGDAAREYLRGLEMSAAVDTDSVTGRQQAAMSREFGGPADQQPGGRPDAQYGDDAFTGTATRLREERAAFESHLQSLLAEHPQLRERFEEYLQARTRHEAVRKK